MKPFYMSSKLWYTVATIIAGLVSKYFGVDDAHVMAIMGTGVALVVGQGMADWGKNAKPSTSSVVDQIKEQLKLFTAPNEEKKAD